MNDTKLKNDDAQLLLSGEGKPRKNGPSRRNTRSATGGPTFTVGFRADARLKDVLKGRADELGITVSDFVKKCVDAHLLEDSTKANAFEAFLELKKAIHNVRIDVAISTEALLQTAGCLTAKQSEEWVTGNLWKRSVKDST